MNCPETLGAVCGQPAIRHRSYLRIGNVSIGLCADSSDDVDLTPEIQRFETPPILCDIEVRLQWVDQLRKQNGVKLFDSGSVWALHENGDDYVFDFVTPVFGDQPYKRLCVNNEFSNAQLWLNRECLNSGWPGCALEYPLDELLVTNWLARNSGVEVHGCGLVDDSTGGHLFLGHSGAGKSTTSRLWRSLRGARVLSDDRIILREESSEIWMYGTPWHGEAGFASPEKTRVHKIFMLEHGNRNEIVPLSVAKAVTALFARCFPPFYSEEALALTLSFLHTIANCVPCYLFRFVPDVTAVREILNFRD